MKRTLFFWLEKLKITPAERMAISGLLILLVILGSLNLALSPPVPFGEGEYRELEQQFKKRSAMLKEKEKKLMQQYYPRKSPPMHITKKDTIPPDSSFGGKAEKGHQGSGKQRIDINTANQTALEELPGIGPIYAQRIIKYRNENDGFDTIDELKKIKGIAQKRLEKLKPFVKLKDSE